MERRYIVFLSLSFLFLTIESITQWLDLSIFNTYIWWALNVSILFCMYKLWRKEDYYNISIIKLWFVLLFCNAIYGCFMAENYWDWKNLVSNLLSFSLPLAALTFCRIEYLTPILSTWVKWIWVIFFGLFVYLEVDAWGRLFVPFYFLALFFPRLKTSTKLMVLFSCAFTIIIGITARSNVLRFGVAFLLGFVLNRNGVYARLQGLLKIVHPLVMVLPFVLFLLAATGVFNVFNFQEELKLSESSFNINNGDTTESLAADSRTFLYVEEIESAIKYNYVLQGRSIARGYECPFFSWLIDDQLRGSNYHKDERDSCEVNILNVFNYFGIIGVLLLFVIFWKSTKKALYNSNNRFVPIIGLFVLFRWLVSWFEDFSRFDMNMLFLWIMIGICFSPYWRNMSDEDIEDWIKQI